MERHSRLLAQLAASQLEKMSQGMDRITALGARLMEVEDRLQMIQTDMTCLRAKAQQIQTRARSLIPTP
jgi:hypothetical protein